MRQPLGSISLAAVLYEGCTHSIVTFSIVTFSIVTFTAAHAGQSAYHASFQALLHPQGTQHMQCLSTSCAQGGPVIVEPYVAAQEFSVTVIEAAGGPVALLPTEISLVDPEDRIIDAQLDLDLHDAATRCGPELRAVRPLRPPSLAGLGCAWGAVLHMAHCWCCAARVGRPAMSPMVIAESTLMRWSCLTSLGLGSTST